MTPLSNMAWDSDIITALNRLTSDKIRNEAYWRETVDNVEDGLNPSGVGRLSLSGLESWVAKCCTSEKETACEDNPSTPPVENRVFRHISPRSN